MANVGVGKLDESSEQAKEEAENWCVCVCVWWGGGVLVVLVPT